MARGRRRSKKQQHATIHLGGEGLSPKPVLNATSKDKRQDKTAAKGTMEPVICLKGSNNTLNGNHEDAQCNNDKRHQTCPPNDASNHSECNGFSGSYLPNDMEGLTGSTVPIHGSPKLNSPSDSNQMRVDVSTHTSISYPNGCQAMCDYCAIPFESEHDLQVHCQTEAHQIVVMSDGEREWKYRPPPRGFMAGSYTLCENWDKTCRYGAQCVEAHSTEELQEWRKRYEYRHDKIQKAEQQNFLKKSYTECLLDKWSHSSNPDCILKEKVDYAEDSIAENQLTTTVSKDSRTDWIFLVKTSKILRAVALLQYADRNKFSIKCVKSVVTGHHKEWKPENTDEWLLSETDSCNLESLQKTKSHLEFKHSICVEFFSDIYGTFRQAVAFDFGVEPLMVKHLCVDVRPASFATNVEELKKELFMEERWDENNAEIIKFSMVNYETGQVFFNETEELVKQYPTPTPSTFTLTQSTVTERMITKNNYCSRMHELLGVEEMARYQQVARYNVRSKLNITKSYLLAPAGTAHSTAKFAQNDEMYAVMNLSQAISEDTAAGRLILNNCTSVLLCAADPPEKTTKSVPNKQATETPKKRKVFEALIEDKGKNVIYLKLSSDTVAEYKITGGMVFYAEVQFQLNRLQYCEWHHAVDSIEDYKILFPETFLEPDIPWTPQRQWKEIKETKLNVKQKEAIVAITTPLSIKLPPVLIIGPFGTGKTYTLAQAIKQLLTVPEYRILVCTHSNSAADIYIQDYLHPYVLSGHEAARPLRIYYHKRWVSTVQPIVQKYCLIETNNGMRHFKVPSKEDVEKHRVIVVTLNMSMVLATLKLNKGFFTHILLDEAAQAMECEAIMPLAVAGEKTRIVLAGDHMQLNPELFSPFAKERNLQMSLLERLYDHYPTSFPCKILLTENYRAHEAIIKFTSDLFYDQKLVSSGRQPRHPRYFPLTFYSCRGEDVQETNSTGHYNLAEVYEIAERVTELRQSWPKEWGELNDQSIGIMTPYADQVFRIRCELRRKRLGGISVERVLNVQGKQFRAILISTVRTRRTCTSGVKSSGNEDSEYGFLSNSKLLNTAITRAQSLVAVVGDPIALCSLGRCRKVWERYIQICDENQSLFGIPWSTIQAHLDGVEFKPNYGLNPLAPEFIPMGTASQSCRRNQTFNNRAGNDAFVFNGFQSHMSYFDQSSPEQCPPALPYQPPWYGPGSAPMSPHVEGNAYQNVYQPAHITSTSQQLCGMYQVPQQTAQPWSVQPDPQFRSVVMQNQAQQPHAYLIGTCKLQSNPDMMQSASSVCSPNGSVHFIPQSARLWPGPNNHVIPGGVSIPANINPKPYDTAVGGKLVVQGAVDIPGIEFLGNGLRVGKVNGIMVNPGMSGVNPGGTSNIPIQSLPSNSVECAPYPTQHIVQSPQLLAQGPSQLYLGARHSTFSSHAHFAQQHQQQALLQQLSQVQNQAMQSPASTNQNSSCHQLVPNSLLQQPLAQNIQPQNLTIQNSHVLQQHQQLLHQQQLQQVHHQQLQQQQLQQLQAQQQHLQQAQHQQLQQGQQIQQLVQFQQPQLTPYEQLRLQQEWQQHQQMALMAEQRKQLLGHILTPLVNCNNDWNKLIPRGVNLLDMVDNKGQQEAWFDHMMKHGQAALARRFTYFMGLCYRAITGVLAQQKPPLPKFLDRTQTLEQNEDDTLNSEQSIEGAASNNLPEPGNLHNSNEPKASAEPDKDSDEPVIMMKDLDPKYMLGSDPFLNGGRSVWAIAQDELAHCSRNNSGVKSHSKSLQRSLPKSETYDSDDSGDELLSSINRQLGLQQSDD
ncbi:probable helicase with zinc finger domain [Frankliniella occidentalis]|uniref:Probable helicase with zinc finger domain n=1 Tax=Frankliniella occidentalis TaxID=133901 RepID=A0A6J1RZ21_FRAOC|nr:probable helicase with zinc finger domain [Frankliniella occidentalis]